MLFVHHAHKKLFSGSSISDFFIKTLSLNPHFMSIIVKMFSIKRAQSLIDADFYTYYADGLVTVSVSCTSGTVSLAPGTFNSLVFTAGASPSTSTSGGCGMFHTLVRVFLLLFVDFLAEFLPLASFPSSIFSLWPLLLVFTRISAFGLFVSHAFIGSVFSLSPSSPFHRKLRLGHQRDDDDL